MTDILPQIQDDAITIENISNTEINEENNYTDVSKIIEKVNYLAFIFYFVKMICLH